MLVPSIRDVFSWAGQCLNVKFPSPLPSGKCTLRVRVRVPALGRRRKPGFSLDSLTFSKALRVCLHCARCPHLELRDSHLYEGGPAAAGERWARCFWVCWPLRGLSPRPPVLSPNLHLHSLRCLLVLTVYGSETPLASLSTSTPGISRVKKTGTQNSYLPSSISHLEGNGLIKCHGCRIQNILQLSHIQLKSRVLREKHKEKKEI